jgi:hypothetical protein
MGNKVYAADTLAQGVDVFVHNLKHSSEGLSALIINTRDSEFSFEIQSNANQYLLTADELLTKTVKLNGEALRLTPDDTLPEIKGKEIKEGEVIIPAHSIMFLSFNSK